jgi:hypothetical protein
LRVGELRGEVVVDGLLDGSDLVGGQRRHVDRRVWLCLFVRLADEACSTFANGFCLSGKKSCFVCAAYSGVFCSRQIVAIRI